MWVRGGGLSSTDAPPQKAFHLGGRGSAPGYRYRGVTGRGYVIAKGEAWFNIRPGTLSLRLFTGTGWVLDQDAFTPRPRMEPRWPTLPFAGIGVGTLHDMVRFDAAWGMRDGSVEVTVSANPRLRSLL